MCLQTWTLFRVVTFLLILLIKPGWTSAAAAHQSVLVQRSGEGKVSTATAEATYSGAVRPEFVSNPKTTAVASKTGFADAPGWYEIPNTKLQTVCPLNGFGATGYPFSDNCHNIAEAWGGAAGDRRRNRMIIWGGGHSDYSGNEVYELDLNRGVVQRVTDPTLPLASDCSEELSGSTPNSRHTYYGLTYVPDIDALLSFSGSLAPTGCASKALWKFDLEDRKWGLLKPSGHSPEFSGGVTAAAYDPRRKAVFLSTESYGSFARYDYRENRYTILNRGAVTDFHESAVIDPRRDLFLLFGGGFAHRIDISGRDSHYALKEIKAIGCGFVAADNPGVAYDETRGVIVGWAGGDSVYLYHPERDSCSRVAYANGPGPQMKHGTNGRFQYFPSLDLFALVNGFDKNAYVLKLGDLAGSEPTTKEADGRGSHAEREGRKAEGSSSNTIPTSSHSPPKMDKTTKAQDKRPPANADQDFQKRCHAPSVIKCVGWDNPSDFVPAYGGSGYADGLYPADDGTFQGTMDAAVKTSGAGSLRFTIRPNVTANSTGYWRANFGPLVKRTKFGPHTTLYLQFRLRLDANMLNFPWNKVSNEGWKVFIVYGPIPGPSCTGAQFVQENTYQTNVATAYTSCGTPALYTNDGKPPMLIEQGDYKCAYNSEGGYSRNSNCFAYPADTWITEYWVVDIGDFGQPNTHFTAYIAAEGKPLKRFIDLPNFRFNSDAEVGDALETMLLQPYMSGANGSKSNPTAHIWFDELIISTQPIPAPMGQ